MSSSASPSPKRRKKGLYRSSSLRLPMPFRALSKDEDALRYLCSFLEPSGKSMGVLNELRRPALMLECDLFFFAFVEQASEARCWKVTTVDKALRFETYYRRQGSAPRNAFLWDLFYWIMDRARFHFGCFRRRADAKVFFCEARSKADYRAFLREYKSVLVKFSKSNFEDARKRLEFCESWDPLFRGCDWHPQDYFLVLMQRKCGKLQCTVPASQKLGKERQKDMESQRELLFSSFDEFLRGDLCLQPLLEKKVKVYEKRHPFPLWRDMILSIHINTTVVREKSSSNNQS